MEIEGLYNGTVKKVALDAEGNVLVSMSETKYENLVLDGSVYSVANQTGITTQAGLSATEPALTLYNPAGSGVNGVLIYAGCVQTVAFAAASVIWLGANTNVVAAAVTGTLTTAHRNGFLGKAAGNNIQALLAATLPAAPVAIATLGVGLTGAITTTPSREPLGRFFDGSIIIAPGTAISFQTSTASGATGFFGEFVWKEVAI
jgi:hypothetical protein